MHISRRSFAPGAAALSLPSSSVTGYCTGLPPAKVLVSSQQPCRRRTVAFVRAQQKQHGVDATGSRKPSAMPRLPERRNKAKQSDSGTRSSRSTNTPRTGKKPLHLGPSLPPEQQQEQALERTLAGLLAYSGLLGTIATGVSMVCPDVDLFGNFNLNPADITLGLQLLLPCCLLNLAIMLPDYSSWKVPPEPTLEEQQRMAESLLAWSTRQKAGAGHSSSSTLNGGQDGAAVDPAQHSSSSGNDSVAGSNSGSSPSIHDPSTAAHSTSHMQVQEAATTTSTSASTSTSRPQPEVSTSTSTTPHPSSSSSSSPANAGSGADGAAGPAVAPPWLVNDPDPPLPLVLARCKDALLMAQGHYLSSSPRILLPWQMQAGVLLVSCLSAELLYRSVVLQVSGGWLTDRILEAGAEDWFLSAAAHLPVLPTPHLTGQLLAVGLLSGAWLVAVARQVLLASRRPSLLLASQGKVAAGQLLDSVRKVVNNNNAKQQQQQGQHEDAQQQRQQGHTQVDAPSLQEREEQASTSSNGSSKVQFHSEEPPAAAATGAADSKQSRSQAAAELAVAAAKAADTGSPKGGMSSSSRVRGGRKSPGMALPNTISALALSHMVTGVRDLSQSAGLGLAFALTGNLAAPFVAAVVTEGLMAVLQRHGRERSRQRSIAFAKHFASFTRVFRDAQRKKLLEEQQHTTEQQQQQQQHEQHAAHQQEASVQPLAAAADMHAEAVLPLAAAPCSPGDDALDTTVAAAVATGAGAAAAAPAGSVVGSRMERTISVLDQLLGEQLAEQAAAAGPHGGK